MLLTRYRRKLARNIASEVDAGIEGNTEFITIRHTKFLFFGNPVRRIPPYKMVENLMARVNRFVKTPGVRVAISKHGQSLNVYATLDPNHPQDEKEYTEHGTETRSSERPAGSRRR